MTEIVGSKDYFPTQAPSQMAKATITISDRATGAPFDPVPKPFLRVPSWMEICASQPSDAEIALAQSSRLPFTLPHQPAPYMTDVIRSFRLLKGASTYLEIGTFDRGSLAYASSLLADDALLIGVDIQAEPERDSLLRSVLKPCQRYVSITGDSRQEKTVSAVCSALDGRGLEATFIDGGHTAHAVMSDFVNYGERVITGGFVLFHDSVWEGNAEYKGSADALGEIDRFNHIYLVPGAAACRRFMRTMWRDDTWGVVGIHRVE